MAHPQLSGKMVSLNGADQYLMRAYPAVNWNALFLRIGFNPNNLPDSTYRTVLDWYPSNSGRLYVFMTCNISYYTIYTLLRTSKGQIYRIVASLGGNGTHTLSMGPVELVIAWNGTHYANYLNGTRVIYEAWGGTFSGAGANCYIGSVTGLSNYFQGDIGHVILHDAIPAPYAGFPEHVYDGDLTATEFLRVHGLTENDVLVLYDWRDEDGKNYGSGGSVYDLTPMNNPTFMDSDFQYALKDAPVCEVALDCSSSPSQDPPASFTFNCFLNGNPPQPGSVVWFWKKPDSPRWLATFGDAQFVLNASGQGIWYVKASVGGDESEIVKVYVQEKFLQTEIYLDCSSDPAQSPPASFLFHATSSGNIPQNGTVSWFWKERSELRWHTISGGNADFVFNSSYHNNTPGVYYVKASIENDESEIVKVSIYQYSYIANVGITTRIKLLKDKVKVKL